MNAPKEWKFYLPGEGETPDDAVVIEGKVYDAEHAAEKACERDWNNGGWERDGAKILIAVISPDGEESRFQAWSEPSVEHFAREAEQ